MSWQSRTPEHSISPMDLAIDDLAGEASLVHFGSLTPQGQSDIIIEETEHVSVPTQSLIANACGEESFDYFFPKGAKLSDYPCLSIALRSHHGDVVDKGVKSELRMGQSALMDVLGHLGIEDAISLVSYHENPEDIAKLGGKFVLQVVVPPEQRQALSELAAQLQYRHAVLSKNPPDISII